MSEAVYKKVEVTGTSPKSSDAAIRNAIERASKSLRKMGWFEVTEHRGRIDNGKVAEWQVTLKIGFKLDDE